MEMLVLLVMLDAEKIVGDYLVYLYGASEGTKEGLPMCYTCLLRIFSRETSFNWERVGGYGFLFWWMPWLGFGELDLYHLVLSCSRYLYIVLSIYMKCSSCPNFVYLQI